MTTITEELSSIRQQKQGRPGRILTIDIERLPGTAYLWEPKTKYVSPRNFIEWPRMVCFAARWYGQKRVIFEAEWKDREKMIAKAWELYNEADAVVTFNGKRFDNKHLKSDWLMAEMPPPTPWKDIDLFQHAKQFGFESKSLDSLTRRLGRPGKETFYDLQGTLAAVAGDKAEQKKLKEYNVGDIELTEWLYDRLTGWISVHPHIGQSDKLSCNQCGSKDLKDLGRNYSAVMLEYRMYRCNVCEGLIRSNWTVARKAISRGIS